MDQWNNSQEIAWSDARPGDLVFYDAPANTDANHVGIVVGRDTDGSVIAAHESSSQNNVVVSKAKDAGFSRVRRLEMVAKNDAAQNALFAAPRAGEPIIVHTPGVQTKFSTMADAFNFIKGDNRAIQYTVQLAADYTYTAADDDALKTMGALASPEVVITSYNNYTLKGTQDMNLPENWPSGTTKFTFQSIKTDPRTFYANNSPIVMGAGVVMPSGKCSVFGSIKSGVYNKKLSTSVTIKSGDYTTVSGGFDLNSYNDTTSESPLYVKVEGGSIDTVYGGGGTKNGNVLGNATIDISGGNITKVQGTNATNLGVFNVATNINLSGGNVGTVTVLGSYLGGTAHNRYNNVNITGDTSVGTVTRFDTLNIAAGKTLTVTGGLDYSGGTNATNGVLRFNGNSTFVSTAPLPAGKVSGLLVARLDIRGANNRVKCTKNSPISIQSSRPTLTDGNKLIIGPHADGSPGADGEIILRSISNGVIKPEQFIVDFGNATAPNLEDGGMIWYLRAPRIRVTNTSPTGAKTEKGFLIMADAFRYIAAENKTGDYEIALLRDYEFTQADANALSGIGVKLNASTINVTGKPSADSKIYMMTGIQAVTLPDQGALPQEAKTTFICHDLRSDSRQIYAQATPIILDQNCSLYGGAYMRLYGGYKQDPGTPYQSSIVMRSGTMGVLSGGSETGTSSTDSVYNVEVDGTSAYVENLFGAGSNALEAQQMNGDATLYVKNGKVDNIIGMSNTNLSTPGKRTDIFVEGGTVKNIKGTVTSSGAGGRTTSIYLSKSMELINLQAFDLLQIDPGLNLTVTGMLNSGASYGGAKGVISLGKPVAGSTAAGGVSLVLKINNPNPTTAGTLEVYGAGNSLQTYRGGPLTLDSTTPVTGDGNLLTLMPFAGVTGYYEGDAVLKFTTAANADPSQYINGFIGYKLKKDGGSIVLDPVNFRLVHKNMSNVPTYSMDFVTFADTVAYMKAQNEGGYYQITLYRDHTFTPEENGLISNLAGMRAKQIGFDGYQGASFISGQSLVLPSEQDTVWSFDNMGIDLTSAAEGNNYILCRRTPINLGSNINVAVGGSLPDGLVVYGDSPVMTTGTKGTNIKILGGTYARVVGACDGGFDAPIEIAIGGGTYNGDVTGGNSGGNTRIVAGYGSPTVKDLYAFDTLDIAQGRAITITGNITSTKDYPAAKGVIRFNGNSKLITQNANPAYGGMNAGTFEINGTGNVLRSVKGKPLYMNGGPVTGGGKLQLGPYADGSAAAPGDTLLSFSSADSANTSDYVLGFNQSAWTPYKNGGKIIIAENVIKVTHRPPSGSPTATMFPTLADAFRHVKADDQPGEYTVEATKAYNSTTVPWYNANEDKAALLDMTPLKASKVTIGTARPASTPTNMAIPNVLPDQGGVAQEQKTRFVISGISRVGSDSFYAQASPVTFRNSNTANSIYGGYAEVPATPYSTDVTLESGGVRNIYGGSKGSVSSVAGSDFHVTVSGGRVSLRVYGGDDNLSLNGGDDANITVDITGGEIGVAVFGAKQAGDATGKIEVNYSGGKIEQDSGAQGSIKGVEYHYGSHPNVDITINVNADLTNTSLGTFDTLNIAAGVNVVAAGALNARASGSDPYTLKGNVVFNGNSKVDLSNTDAYQGNIVGMLTVNGTGNELVLPKYSDGGFAGLILYGSAPHAGSGVLRAEYPAGAAPTMGDELIKYQGDNASDAADLSRYDFTAFGMPVIKKSGSDFFGVGVYLVLGYTTTLETKQADGTWGTPASFGSVADALNAIGSGTGEYRVTSIADNYVFTQADGIAIATQGGNAKKIIFTSADAAGIPRSVKSNGNVSLYPANTHTEYVFDSILFDCDTADRNIFANGHKVSFGTGEPGSTGLTYTDSTKAPTIYGGCENAVLTGDTNLVFNAGQYGRVFGGGKNAGADVNGNTMVTVNGSTDIYQAAHGGGQAGNVTGTATLNIAGGIHYPPAGTEAYAIAGGETGSVGNAELNLTGGHTDSAVSVAGVGRGTVTGNVHINVDLPAAASAGGGDIVNVYGSYEGGTIGGDVTIDLSAFTRYGTVSGGGKPGSVNADSCVAGTRTVNFLKNNGVAEPVVKNVLYFDELNAGQQAKTTLTVTGDLDSNPGATMRTGTLRITNNSVVDLDNAASNTRHIGNIETDGMPGGDRSHLHVKKTATGTQPLMIDGINNSGNNQLVIGMILQAPVTEESGDEILVFHTPANAVPAQYVSDYSGLTPYVKGGNKIALGRTGDLNVSLTNVTHSARPDVPGDATAVQKTVTALIDTNMDGGTFGADASAAYISTSVTPDPGWAGGGALPAGCTAMTLTDNGNHAWTATATMPIKPPVGPDPQYYFLHTRNADDKTTTIVIDVHAPIMTPGADISTTQEPDGSTQVSLTVNDIKPDRPAGVPPSISYQAHGIKQVGWSIGENDGAGILPDMRTAEAHGKTPMMGVADVAGIDNVTPYQIKIPLSKDSFTGTDVLYVYVKDNIGNTQRFAIPMADKMIDVSAPLKVSTVALKGAAYDDMANKLLAPKCEIVNHSTMPLTAEIVSYEQGTGPLTLVSKESGFATNEINLRVAPLAGASAFSPLSVVSISDTRKVPVGTVAAAGGIKAQTGFTFDALYDHKKIITTADWSTCVLGYRFTPVTGP